MSLEARERVCPQEFMWPKIIMHLFQTWFSLKKKNLLPSDQSSMLAMAVPHLSEGWEAQGKQDVANRLSGNIASQGVPGAPAWTSTLPSSLGCCGQAKLGWHPWTRSPTHLYGCERRSYTHSWDFSEVFQKDHDHSPCCDIWGTCSFPPFQYTEVTASKQMLLVSCHSCAFTKAQACSELIRCF